MISFITSLYKSEKYILKFLKNILIVNDKMVKNNLELEVIVIGNELSEFEKENLYSFAKKNNFIKIFEVKLEPLYASWNRGVNLSNGNLIGFWNVDDKRFAKSIIKTINSFEKSNYDLIYFPFIYKRYLKIGLFNFLIKVKKIIPKDFNKNIFKREMHIGPFFIFRKEFYHRVGKFDESFKIAGDFDWQVRAADIGEFFLSKEIGGVFKNDGSGLSGRKNPLHQEENKIIYQKIK